MRLMVYTSPIPGVGSMRLMVYTPYIHQGALCASLYPHIHQGALCASCLSVHTPGSTMRLMPPSYIPGEHYAPHASLSHCLPGCVHMV